MTKYYILTGKNTDNVIEYLFGAYQRIVVHQEKDEYINHPGNSEEYSNIKVHKLDDDKQTTIDAFMATLNPIPEPQKLAYKAGEIVYEFTIQTHIDGKVYLHSNSLRNRTKECFHTERVASISTARQSITNRMASINAKRLHNT